MLTSPPGLPSHDEGCFQTLWTLWRVRTTFWVRFRLRRALGERLWVWRWVVSCSWSHVHFIIHLNGANVSYFYPLQIDGEAALQTQLSLLLFLPPKLLTFVCQLSFKFEPLFWGTFLKSNSEKGANLEEMEGHGTWVASSLMNQGMSLWNVRGLLPEFNSWNWWGEG